MKTFRFLFLFIFAAHTAVAQTNQGVSQIVVNANGDVLNSTATNYPAGKLKLAGSTVSLDPIYRDLNYIATSAIDAALVGKSPSDEPLFSVRDDNAGNYTRNASCWAAPFDLTSASVWNSEAGGTPPNRLKTATAISPRHVVMADHYYPPNGSTLRFVPRDGSALVTRTLTNSVKIGATDIRIGILNADLPATIAPARVLLTPFAEEKLLGAATLLIDQDQSAYVGDLLFAGGGSVAQITSPASNRAPFFKSVIGGDSSHPVFAIIDGLPVLLMTFENSGNQGPSIASQYAAINAAMTSLGGSYQLTPLRAGVLGSAALVNAGFMPTSGQVPTVDGAGHINPAVVPDIVTTQFGAQDYGALLAAPPLDATHTPPGQGQVLFRRLTETDLPGNLILGATQGIIEDTDVNPAFGTGLPSWNGIASVIYNSLTAPRTVTMPTSQTGAVDGRIIIVADHSGNCSATNTITLTRGNTSHRINGQISWALRFPYAAAMLEFRQGKWSILGIFNSNEVGDALLTPAQINGNQNDYAPAGLTNANTVLLDVTAGDWSITGIAGGWSNRSLTLINKSANSFFLAKENSGSTAANRFYNDTYGIFTVYPGNFVRLRYDSAISRWRIDQADARALSNLGSVSVGSATNATDATNAQNARNLYETAVGEDFMKATEDGLEFHNFDAASFYDNTRLAFMEALGFVVVSVPNVDFKTVQVRDLYNVPAGKTFVMISNTVVVTASASVTATGAFNYIESGASQPMTASATTSSTANMALNKWYSIPMGGTNAASENFVICAGPNKVQLNISTAATATTLTGTVTIVGFLQ